MYVGLRVGSYLGVGKMIAIGTLGLVRGYKTVGDRKRAVAMLRKYGYNYFVSFADAACSVALLYDKAQWVPAGDFYHLR